MPALEADLSEFVELWNTHLIRRNRLADCPSGVPKEMYETPGLVGKISYGVDHAVKTLYYTT